MKNLVIHNDAAAEENQRHINVSSLATDKNQEQIIQVYLTKDDVKDC